MAEIKFRAMTLADIAAVGAIEQEAFTSPWSEAAFYNELTNNQFAYYTVVECEGDVIGYGGMWAIVEEAHVTNIAISSRYRRKGIGTRLLHSMQETALLLGMKNMTLEVRISNLAAQSIYEKLGFRAEGVRKRYYTDNQEDALIMWAELDEERIRALAHAYDAGSGAEGGSAHEREGFLFNSGDRKQL